MKVLSIKQPWSWLIIKGFKDIENRNWKTNFRGEFYVHASKGFDLEGYNWVKKNFPNIPLPKPEEFKLGGIVGKTTLVDCVSSSDSPWFFGDFGFMLKDSKEVTFIPLKGQLSFFSYDG